MMHGKKSVRYALLSISIFLGLIAAFLAWQVGSWKLPLAMFLYAWALNVSNASNKYR